MDKWWATKLTSRDLEISHRRENEKLFTFNVTYGYGYNQVEVRALNEQEARDLVEIEEREFHEDEADELDDEFADLQLTLIKIEE